MKEILILRKNSKVNNFYFAIFGQTVRLDKYGNRKGCDKNGLINLVAYVVYGLSARFTNNFVFAYCMLHLQHQ